MILVDEISRYKKSVIGGVSMLFVRNTDILDKENIHLASVPNFKTGTCTGGPSGGGNN